jgi:hypothetical protein
LADILKYKLNVNHFLNRERKIVGRKSNSIFPIRKKSKKDPQATTDREAIYSGAPW